MTVDWTRVPVVVGAGQFTGREKDPHTALDPFGLMQEASLAAAASVGRFAHDSASLFGHLTHIWMVHSLSLRHGDPARELALRLGAPNAEARCSGMGGSIPQWLVNRAAEEIIGGGRPRVLICGAEALATKRRAKKAGVTLQWPTSDGWPDTWPPIEPDVGVHGAERANGLAAATTMYALVESAIGHAVGEDLSAHRHSMGTLMARLNDVAVANPYSWFPEKRSALDIATPSPENRMVSFPYPKYMNAIMDVDMAAAVIITDAATAQEWGLASDEVAYLRGWADAHDIWYLSQRPQVHRSTALDACAASSLKSAGIGVDDVGAFDLYSCFPSSVEAAQDSFSLARNDARPITLTGGLPYHGGPGSNYVTHAVANTLNWLRSGKGDYAVVHSNGYYLTKHAVGVYSRRPPTENPDADLGLQDRLDAEASPISLQRAAEGTGQVVAYTVPFDRAGDAGAGVLLVDVGENRAVLRADGALTAAMLREDVVGAKVMLAPDDGDEGAIVARPG
jgi:acetyl-CoA C-acetyltransferase